MSHFFIDGTWTDGTGTRRMPILNPATGESVGELPVAEKEEVDLALKAVQSGFDIWRKVPALDRYRLLRKAAANMRERQTKIAELITLEQGKPYADAVVEASGLADYIDWYAEEARRAYGRIIPSRNQRVAQSVLKEPIGPVAAFTPWNAPAHNVVKKVAGALAAGCSVIVKPAEETPSSCIEAVHAFEQAGFPAGVLNMIFGDPAEISQQLLTSRIIRCVSFTGSVQVGQRLAALAALQSKRTILELGGHAPFIVCEDADLENAAQQAAALKFRNAGQICVSPTRFFIHSDVFDRFTGKFIEHCEKIQIGDGFAEGVTMGPLIRERRLEAIATMVDEAVSKGAKVLTGGERFGNRGFFYKPTLLQDVPDSASAMQNEPFGPVALLARFSSLDDAIGKANSLPFGLAAYGFTRSASNVFKLTNELEAGNVAINHYGLAIPEVPFGGTKDSGDGYEGGIEGLNAFLSTKFVTHLMH